VVQKFDLPYLHALLKLAHIFCVGLYCGNDWKILFAVDFFVIKFLLDPAMRLGSNFINNFRGPLIISSSLGGDLSTPLHALGAS
jgi:hypothetical protein